MEFIQFVRDHARRMFAWSIATLLTLFPAVFFPHSVDLSVFLRVAHSLQSGGILYHDAVDIKPPLLYDIIRGIFAFSGDSETAYHAADTLLLFVALLVSCYLLFKITNNPTVSIMSTWIMAFSFVSVGATFVSQAEVFALLPVLLIIERQLRDQDHNSLKNGLFIGVLTAILVGLKLTLASTLVVIAICDLNERGTRREFPLTKWMGIAVGVLAASVVIWRTLMDARSLEGFRNLLQFMQGYASSPALDGAFVASMWKSVVILFFDRYSIAFALLAGTGFSLLLYGNNHERRVLRILTLTTCVFVITVILERKFFPYHFLRVVIPLAVFSAYGVDTVRRTVREVWTRKQERVLIVAVLGILVVWSPIARFITFIKPTYTKLAHPEKFDSLYQRKEVLGLYRAEEQTVCDSILRNRKVGDHTLFASINSPRMALVTNDGDWSFAAASQFALSDFAPTVWKLRYADEMRRARWLVVGTNDSNQYFNSPTTTSLRIMEEREPFRSVFIKEYRRCWATDHFMVFERSTAPN
ncbi:MAG: hypothetical protein RL156_1261 [Bacteroidota bacterium]